MHAVASVSLALFLMWPRPALGVNPGPEPKVVAKTDGAVVLAVPYPSSTRDWFPEQAGGPRRDRTGTVLVHTDLKSGEAKTLMVTGVTGHMTRAPRWSTTRIAGAAVDAERVHVLVWTQVRRGFPGDPRALREPDAAGEVEPQGRFSLYSFRLSDGAASNQPLDFGGGGTGPPAAPTGDVLDKGPIELSEGGAVSVAGVEVMFGGSR